MIIVGLNAFHADSAAAILRDGRLIAAVEEERFRRVKHWAGFPTKALEYCLNEARVTLSEVQHVAFNQNSRTNFGRKVWYLLSSRPNPRLVFNRLRNRRARSALPSFLNREFPGEKIQAQFHGVGHHLAHLSSAFHVSPFDEAAVVSIDGFGDFLSAEWGAGAGSEITSMGRVFFPHSLGIFYQAITQYLGFYNYGDEYKVMGLAPYGRPTFLEEMNRIVQTVPDGGYNLNMDFFRHQRDDLADQWDGGSPVVGQLFSSELEALLGPRRAPDEPIDDRHRDIARSAQAMYEICFFHLLNVLHERTRLYDVALAGGCAMNSVANGKIRRMTPFRRVYVQAAAGDAGGAIGSAFAVWHELGGKRRFVMNHAYWGPAFDADNIAGMLSRAHPELVEAGCTIEKISDEITLCNLAAGAIARGQVVGWFQGRLEWGPRALGNRSIVCDPRRPDMKALLNAKIKRRESFRPFAPSIVEEAVKEWFEEDDSVPFMMQVFQIREDKRALIPAVTHVDGSGRLQTVSRSANPRYHLLIERFRALTGIPMVLNTSFNENEPVVCTPEEAMLCFLRTKMDVLVIENFIISRQA